jgi:hypothetical protein
VRRSKRNVRDCLLPVAVFGVVGLLACGSEAAGRLVAPSAVEARSGAASAASASTASPVPLEPSARAPAASDAAGPLEGTFEDHGACISRAPNLDAVQRWAESLELPERFRRERGVEVFVEDGDRSAGGKVDGRTVTFLTQYLRASTFFQARKVVVLEGTDGFMACVVHDELLEFGYLEPPSPVKGSLRAAPNGGFSYRAGHSWNGASAEEFHEVDWEIRCVVRDGRLGCVAATTRRLDGKKPIGAKERTTTTREAQLTWRGDVLEWRRENKTLTATLTPGSARIIDWNGEATTLAVKGRAAEQPRR